MVGETRGVSLIGALELVRDKASKGAFAPAAGVGLLAAEIAQGEGLILRAMGDSLALCPPLVTTEAEIDEIFDYLTRALERAQRELKQAADCSDGNLKRDRPRRCIRGEICALVSPRR